VSERGSEESRSLRQVPRLPMVAPLEARGRRDEHPSLDARFGRPPPGGGLYEYRMTGLVQKGVWKLLKTKDDCNKEVMKRGSEEVMKQ
jgi:hypothetical protein